MHYLLCLKELTFMGWTMTTVPYPVKFLHITVREGNLMVGGNIRPYFSFAKTYQYHVVILVLIKVPIFINEK